MSKIEVKMVTILENDYHSVFDPIGHTMKVFSRMRLEFECDAHGDGVNGPGFDRSGGDTVPGLYKFGKPIWTEKSEPVKIWHEYGFCAIPMIDYQGNEAKEGRDGIMAHGGGSGAIDPLAKRQGWIPTLGCIRLQNEDVIKLGHFVDKWIVVGTVWVSVLNWGY